MLRPVVFLACGLLLVGLGSSAPSAISEDSSIDAISKNVNELEYYYYPTKDVNHRVSITFNNRNSLDESNIKANTPTIIVIDGFLSDSTAPMSSTLPKTLAAKGGVNVMLLDWGKLSGAGMTLGNQLQLAAAYLNVLGNVGPIGNRLAEFLYFLKENKGIAFEDVTIVGGSLGAHIGGATGVWVKRLYPGNTLGRVVGLDPAGPFFSLQLDKDKRLHKGDALVVEIYHSNRGTLGDASHDGGDVNIYVNGGDKQPGCEEADAGGFAGLCSHAFAWQTFSAAVNGELEACPCTTNAECTCTNCAYECENPIKLGPGLQNSAKGRYHATVLGLE